MSNCRCRLYGFQSIADVAVIVSTNLALPSLPSMGSDFLQSLNSPSLPPPPLFKLRVSREGIKTVLIALMVAR